MQEGQRMEGVGGEKWREGKEGGREREETIYSFHTPAYTCIRSYENSQRATEDGTLGREIVPVSVPQRKGKPDIVVKHDEEFTRCSVHVCAYVNFCM